MSYEKTNWQPGDVITSEKLNHLEDGVGDAGSTFTVTVTQSGSTYSADKTTSEINEAYVAGSRIEFKLGDLILLPTSITSSIVMAGVTVTDDTVRATSYALVMIGSTVSLITDGVFSTYINVELKTDPNSSYSYILFDSDIAASKAQGGAIFDIFQGNHHMLCQISGVDIPHRFYATIIDAANRCIYVCKLDFTTGTAAYILNLQNMNVSNPDRLDIISVSPHELSPAGRELPAYYGYDSAGNLGFHYVTPLKAFSVRDSVATLVETAIAGLKAQAAAASDGMASGYVPNPEPDAIASMWSSMFDGGAVPIFVVVGTHTYRIFTLCGGVLATDSQDVSSQSIRYTSTEVVEPSGGGNAELYTIEITFTPTIAIVKVTYTSVPAIPLG